METVNIWQALAQSGIAILVLGVGTWLFWKQIQTLISKQDERTKALEASQTQLQKEKDDLQREFRDMLSKIQDKSILMETQWMKTIAEHTAVLKDLKKLIEQKF